MKKQPKPKVKKETPKPIGWQDRHTPTTEQRAISLFAQAMLGPKPSA